MFHVGNAKIPYTLVEKFKSLNPDVVVKVFVSLNEGMVTMTSFDLRAKSARFKSEIETRAYSLESTIMRLT